VTNSPRPETEEAYVPGYDRLILFIGSLAHTGFVPFASGTVAVALWGVPLAILLLKIWQVTVPVYVAICIGLTLFSIWVAGEADRVLNEKDSRKNVIDEIPGYLIALIGLPASGPILIVAFFLERVIDIAKIWPANLIERHFPGGWGVVLDDVMAGIYTVAILHALAYFAPTWFNALAMID